MTEYVYLYISHAPAFDEDYLPQLRSTLFVGFIPVTRFGEAGGKSLSAVIPLESRLSANLFTYSPSLVYRPVVLVSSRPGPAWAACFTRQSQTVDWEDTSIRLGSDYAIFTSPMEITIILKSWVTLEMKTVQVEVPGHVLRTLLLVVVFACLDVWEQLCVINSYACRISCLD